MSPGDRTLILGTHIHPATGESARRQTRANSSLLQLKHVQLINLQFSDRKNLISYDGFETKCVLKQDSLSVSGKEGIRKPIVSELFTTLAEEARERGQRYFGFTNSDILISQSAVDRIFAYDKQSFIFSRTDFKTDPKNETGTMLTGTDFFVVEADWWLENRRRFRTYIIGEMAWDNVYTSQLLCHSDGILLNREPLIRHEEHPSPWGASPFCRYNGYQAALDSPYFSLWCDYIGKLKELRKGRATESEEIELQRNVFRWLPRGSARIKHGVRAVKAWVGYSLGF